MKKLYFITSNRTKLMHARHLAQRYEVEIRGKKYYGVAYREPRLQDRNEILKQSYEDALSRWLKTSGNREGFFFIEDTSVMLEALSQSVEFPGPDVKYWMRDTTFSEVDRLLKEHGNNRRAIVRSDVVLHLPTPFRKATGIRDKYKVFTGKTCGTVTDREIRLNTNLLYPWLDNLSFNRWFIPLGCDKPISALPIHVADKFDFRAGSIGAMLDFLSEYGVVGDQKRNKFWPATLFLPHLFPPLLIVTGLPCAGKTMLGMYLSEKCGYYHIEASDFMKLAFYERHGLRSQLSIHVFAERALREKPDIVVRPVLDEIERRKAELVVITGFRSPEEIEIFIRDYSGPSQIQSWFINASLSIRFQRNLRRGRRDSAESLLEFRRRDKLQLRMGLREIQEILAKDIMSNEASKRHYLNVCLRKLGLDPKSILWPKDREFRARPRSLEETILLGLAKLQKTGKDALSTTEIAHELNRIFGPSDFQTNKNNVSRYFNFRVHPFYKISLFKRTLRYGLSATGFSLAQRILDRGVDVDLDTIYRAPSLRDQDFTNAGKTPEGVAKYKQLILL